MPNNETLTDKIISRFDTWKFKRERPDREKLRAAIRVAVEESRPIKFIIYWGKGARDNAGKPEIVTLNFLRDFFDRIKDLYQPGIELLILFTDTHAQLNGYADDGIRKYFVSMENLTKTYGFKTTYLSDLVVYDKDKLKSLVDSVYIENVLLKILCSFAEKHYQASDDYIFGAKLYYLQNQLERKAIDDRYRDFIFLTFNGSELNDLFPKALPIFYMYSMKKGSSIKPWFVS